MNSIASVRTARRWTVYQVAATPETLLSTLTEAYLTGTFGDEEPVLIRVGEGFWKALCASLEKIPQHDGQRAIDQKIFMAAMILVDSRFDSWKAHIYMWDRESFEFPILFVTATVIVKEGAQEAMSRGHRGNQMELYR